MPFPADRPNGASLTPATPRAIPPDWLAEFEAAARRPLALRFKYAFIRFDDAWTRRVEIEGFPV